jgi:hypothetical protein
MEQAEEYQKSSTWCMVVGAIIAAILIIAVVVVAGAKTA